VIALTIVDFVMFDDLPDLISRFRLIEKDRLIEYMGDIELIFIELPKFTKEEGALDGVLDRWIYFIKNAGKLDYIPKDLNVELQRAFEIANEANFTEEELELQHRKKDWVYIQKSSIEHAKKQGVQAGIQQGIEQGIEKVVQNASVAGMSTGMIAQITGLEEARIQEILRQKTKHRS